MNRVSVNGTEIAYVTSGPEDGDPVVLSHSLFFDHTMFAELSTALAAAGYRVIAYDHRNQGASEPAPRDRLEITTLVADAAALIETLGLRPCHFAGNSLGGMVAIGLAIRHPDLLRSVTPIAASAEEEYALPQFAPLADQLGAHGPAELLDPLMYIMFGDTTLADRPELAGHWRQRLSELPTRIADSARGVIHRPRVLEQLTGCRVPLLAIAGAEDHAYPQPISGENIAAAAGGREVTIAGSGHSAALECADEAARELLPFLQSVGSPAAAR